MSQIIECILDQDKNEQEATIILKSHEGEARHTFTLPWLDSKEWNAVFGYLKAYKKYPKTWPTNPETIDTGRELGFVDDDGSPSSGRIRKIGKHLYETVFGDEKIRRVFQHALRNSKQKPPIVILHITDKGRFLQTYPWEGLHDGEDFLFDADRAVLVRWIDFGKALKPLQVGDELNLLLVDPRPEMPKEYDTLPASTDKDILKEYLAAVNKKLIVHDLEATPYPMSTLVKVKHFSSRAIQIVHIDVHGDLGRFCGACNCINPHNAASCQGCGKHFSKEQPIQGYLALQDSKNKLVWKDGKLLGKAINKENVNLVVLSACNSGLVAGGTVFNSVAGALIKQGVPAVIAMQFPVEIESTKLFVHSFYNALLNREPLTTALATARTCLLADFEDAWYRPVLYLRTDETNIQGEIFKPGQSLPYPQIDVEEKNQAEYQWDIFLSHEEKPDYENWIYNVFLDDLQRYLKRGLPDYEPKIFQPRKLWFTEANPDAHIKKALLHSHCCIAICSPGYFQTRRCRYELAVMLQRMRRVRYNDMLILIKAHDGDRFPKVIEDIKIYDCRSYTRENLRMAPRYVEFEDLIENLSERIAQTIMNPPQWDEDFHADIIPDESLIDALKPVVLPFGVPRYKG